MPRRLLMPVLLAACATPLITGCGGGQSQTHAAPSGRELFARACGACHTLSGHDDPRHQGGDLLGFHATRPQMLQLAAEMPVRHPLSQGQLDAVVRFVLSMEAARS
ncbi:MAG: hypothetical protein ACXVRW_13930 [Solirubrobacteraceae bacterium]